MWASIPLHLTFYSTYPWWSYLVIVSPVNIPLFLLFMFFLPTPSSPSWPPWYKLFHPYPLCHNKRKPPSDQLNNPFFFCSLCQTCCHGGEKADEQRQKEERRIGRGEFSFLEGLWTFCYCCCCQTPYMSITNRIILKVFFFLLYKSGSL